MKKGFESTYGRALKGIFFAVNPLKKKLLKTHCTVHKYINIRALEILKNDGYIEESEYFRKHISIINNGATWADQDFKSSNHFFHVVSGIGLYGFSNALKECNKYYDKSISYYKNGNMEKSFFNLGAACHLVQDSTVPQHVNNKLLKSHRQFEQWIIARLMTDYSFNADEGTIKFSSLEEFIKNNAVMANSTYAKYEIIKNKNERYQNMAVKILKQAQRTTAGFYLYYYEEISKI